MTAEAIFMLGFGLVFGFLSGFLFWDVTLNTFRKKRLLDEYAAEGVDVAATLCQQRMNYSTEGPNRYHVEYSYPCPEQAPEQSTPCTLPRHYRKEYSHVVRICRSEPHFDASFDVNVLQGYPKSGIPKAFVDRRYSDYNVCIATGLGLEVFFILYICSGLVLLGIFDYDPPLLMVLKAALLFIAIGFPFASMWFGRWKRKVLEEATYTENVPSPRQRDVATTAEPARESFSAIHADAYVERDNFFSGTSNIVPPLVAAAEIYDYGSIVADQDGDFASRTMKE